MARARSRRATSRTLGRARRAIYLGKTVHNATIFGHAGAALCASLSLFHLLGSGSPLAAQRPTRPPRDTVMHMDSVHRDMPDMPSMIDTVKKHGMAMVPAPLGVSMDRMGSGTTWIPDAVSLPSRGFTAGKWDMMLHGFAVGQYNDQGGPRGEAQLGSLNWGMFMASHELAGGRFQARTMLSLDPATVTARGYPLLLQTGESFHGEPLHDRQHPHDFWMELGAMYERPVSKRVGLELYAAPSGEPALGPVAFMHRPSAMDNPVAPIGHHWQDATHVAFGVLTAGIFTHTWKFEGSVFNGREPDDRRWNFDPIRFDSYSGRVTYNPTANWSLQTGYGYIQSPEGLRLDESIHRLTASAMYGRPLRADGQWATTGVYGGNKLTSDGSFSSSALLESEAILDRFNTVFGRAEYVRKSAEELVLDTPPLNFRPSHEFDVGQVSVGYIRELVSLRGATVGLGAMGTLNLVPSSLGSIYGSRTPLGGLVFLRLRPAGIGMPGMGPGNSMDHMHHGMADRSPGGTHE
jgi:hypothetical protein